MIAACHVLVFQHMALANTETPQNQPQPIRTQLHHSADHCAIFQALTGRTGTHCSATNTLSLGRAKSLPPAGFDTGAAPLSSTATENGYFIRFPFNSNQLTPEYSAHLKRLSDVLASPALQNSCVKLVGHTDSIGGNTFNHNLSASRAKMVAAFLVRNGAISMDRIVTEAQGKAQLLPDVPGPHPLNRRVEILARNKTGDTCR